PLRLIQLHVCAMYVAAAWQRLDDPNWLGGSMVFAAMTNIIFSRLPNIDWHQWKNALAFFTYAALILEVAAPILLWRKKWGLWCVVGLVAMHAGLELFTMTGYWQYMMSLMLVCFLPDSFSKKALELIPTRWLQVALKRRHTQPG
ncbi:MAG: HTTM domain-containing protein, partial [Bdellovibrionales bacterium]|nr:HTTM domain-containing protein [Bdellovibrionales bacterium]